ncbi:hypothetical protein [Bacillus solitudinis]|uniref:hypothetical protein n=1 Tax=Bacillus solitudinis TaxID=2014074 RepID=UPI001D0D1740|nr:hypothetical protein [Bacillus solitudinis]
MIAVLVLIFITEMTPNSGKEETIKNEASQYLNDNFNDSFEVFDALYDNMGNFEFEYAAKARNANNGVDFLIYHDSETEQLVDTYTADKWGNDLENAIRPYLVANLLEMDDYHAFFDDEIGQTLGIDPTKPGSYIEHSVSPTIRITVSREKSNQDDEQFNAFISYLKTEKILEQGTVIVAYIEKNGAIIDQEEWNKEF